jgi:hypothetical protein
MSLADQLTKVVASQMAKSAAQKTGLSEAMAAKLLPIAMAAVMGGVQKNVASPKGAEALANALAKHDGGLLNNLGKAGDDNVLNDGRKILGHVFGGKQSEVERALQKAGGGAISGTQMRDLLAMAAPAVMASLGKAKKDEGLDIGALSGLVKKEAGAVAASHGQELSGFMKLLDADGDGKVSDDALDLGKKIFSGILKK